MRWADVEAQQPRLAELGRRKFAEPGVVLMGTLRQDGSPRVSACEPLFWEGELWLPMGEESYKAKDLFRDPRILVQSIVTNRDGREGQYKVRGRAIREDDRELNERAAETIGRELGWRPVPGRFNLFRIDVDDVAFIRWGDDNDQFLTRWPDGGEQVRRGTSATSVGPPEPHPEFLD